MIRIIGCLIFGAIATGAVMGYRLTRDTHDTVWWENESIRADLAGQLKLAKYRLSVRDTGFDPASLERAEQEKATLQERISSLQKQQRGLTASIRDVETEQALYQERRLRFVQERSLGKEWPEFISGEGRIFKDVKVAAVDDAGVTLRHRDGSTRIRFNELSEAQRAEFGLNEEKAVAADLAERRNAAAYELWQDAEIAKAERKQRLEGRILAQVVNSPIPLQTKRYTKPVDSTLSAAPRILGTSYRRYRGGGANYYGANYGSYNSGTNATANLTTRYFRIYQAVGATRNSSAGGGVSSLRVRPATTRPASYRPAAARPVSYRPATNQSSSSRPTAPSVSIITP